MRVMFSCSTVELVSRGMSTFARVRLSHVRTCLTSRQGCQALRAGVPETSMSIRYAGS